MGGHIPTPGVNADKLQQFFEQNKGSLLGFVDLFFRRTVAPANHFCPGHHALLTASIILQLLTVVYEPLAKLQKKANWGARRLPSGLAI